MANETALSEFLILGFSSLQELQPLMFLIFLITYISTLMGNISIMTIVCLDVQLHTPMYFFLGNLSFLDICYTSTNVPQMLVHLLSEKKTITYAGCAVQLYFFISFVGTECILLAAMAYDRFVAICHPLNYTVIMRKATCLQRTCASWVGGFLNSAVHTYFTFQLPFCGANQINHFFCDIPPLLKLSCADTTFNETVSFVIGIFIGLTLSVCIILSYVYIIATILNINSSKGRIKAFSTCVSHLIVVLLYYGSAMFSYVHPTSSYSLDNDRLISVLYSIVTPMLNPLIYTLRKNDVKNALKQIIEKLCLN